MRKEGGAATVTTLGIESAKDILHKVKTSTAYYHYLFIKKPGISWLILPYLQKHIPRDLLIFTSKVIEILCGFILPPKCQVS